MAVTTTGNMVGVGVGAALGATALVVAAGAVLPVVVVGGTVWAIGAASGAAIGALTGWWFTKPTPEVIVQHLQSDPKMQGLLRR